MGMQPIEDERPDRLKREVDTGVRPFWRMGRVVEACGSVEHCPTGECGIAHREVALGNAVANNACQMACKGVNMRPCHLSRFQRKLVIRGKEFWIVAHLAPLGTDQEVQPAPQSRRGGPLLGRHRRQGRRHTGQPALGHGIA